MAPFGYSLFAGVWLTNTISNFGGQMQAVGAAWLMTSLTSDPKIISLVTSAALLPMLLFSLVAGAVADAVDRRLVLIVAQLTMFAASALLAWLAVEQAVTPAILIGLTFVIGSGFAFNAPAWQAAVRDMVPIGHVPEAISLNIIGFNLSRTAGPALGGMVVGWGGAQASFIVNAASYVGLLVVLARWLRFEKQVSLEPRGRMLGAIRAGLVHVAVATELRRVLIRVTLFGMALGALLALIPIVVRQLGAGPDSMGLVFGCSGGGAVVGALFANNLRLRFGMEPVLRLSIALTAAGMAIVGGSNNLAVTAAAEGLTGFAATLGYTLFNMVMQIQTPRPLLGRVMSIHQMAALGGLALGSWLWGIVADPIGVFHAIILAAVAMAGMLILSLTMPLSSLLAEELV